MRPQRRDRSGVASGGRALSAEVDVVASALLTAGQVAHLLGVPRTWVYEQSRSGRIPTVTLGRYRRYRREAIEAWVRELEQAAPPAAHALGRVRR
jgi:excisionase family DNA binding protein